MTGSWGKAVFDRIYARGHDPWAFESSPYEQAKYAETLAALPRPRFASGLEVGCSIGVQTRLLAARCDALLAIDLSEQALERARIRCAGLSQIQFRQAQVPQDWPPGSFDLIVLSEVLYFLSPGDIASVARLVLGSLRPGAAVLLVNWTGETDTPTTGQAAAAQFCARTEHDLRPVLQRQHVSYRLDLLERVQAADTTT